jgi:hypothetical protein
MPSSKFRISRCPKSTADIRSGNQGTDFRYVPREGFGWMNSAYQVGLQFLSVGMRRALAACVPVSSPTSRDVSGSLQPSLGSSSTCPLRTSHPPVFAGPSEKSASCKLRHRVMEASQRSRCTTNRPRSNRRSPTSSSSMRDRTTNHHRRIILSILPPRV